MKDTEVSQTGFFGKIPSAGDFVGQGQEVLRRHGLGEWLVEGWSRLLSQGRVAAGLGAWSLLSFQQPGEILAAVFQPSRDKVGRLFPLGVFGVFRCDGGCSAGAAVVASAGWQQAARSVSELATRALDTRAVRDHVDGLRRVPVAGAAMEQFTAWQEHQPGIVLWGPDADAAECRLRLQRSRYALEGIARPGYVVRGAAGGDDRCLGALLDLVAAGAEVPVRLAVWDPAPGADHWSWRLLFDEPALRHFEPLMTSDSTSDLVFDSHAGGIAVPSHIAQNLAELDLTAVTVAELVRRSSRR